MRYEVGVVAYLTSGDKLPCGTVCFDAETQEDANAIAEQEANKLTANILNMKGTGFEWPDLPHPTRITVQVPTDIIERLMNAAAN